MHDLMASWTPTLNSPSFLLRAIITGNGTEEGKRLIEIIDDKILPLADLARQRGEEPYLGQMIWDMREVIPVFKSIFTNDLFEGRVIVY